MTDVIDIISLITQRAPIMHHIADGGASKRTLTMTLPVSRATITRAIQDLATAKLIQQDGNQHTLTVQGRIAYREFRRVVDRYDGLTDAMSVLDSLPETTDIPGVVFDEATVIRATPPTPDAPRTRFADRVRQSDIVVGMGIVVNQRLIEVFHDQLTTDDLRLSLLLDEQVVEHLWHTHHNSLTTALRTDDCTLLSVARRFPFSLSIADWTDIWLGIYNERGQVRGVLRSESAAAVEWAQRRLQQSAEQATPVRLRGGTVEAATLQPSVMHGTDR